MNIGRRAILSLPAALYLPQRRAFCRVAVGVTADGALKDALLSELRKRLRTFPDVQVLDADAAAYDIQAWVLAITRCGSVVGSLSLVTQQQYLLTHQLLAEASVGVLAEGLVAAVDTAGIEEWRKSR